MEPVVIHVDGIDVKIVDKQGAQVLEKGLATRNDALAEALAKCDALQGRLDAEVAAHKETKVKLAKAEDPTRLDEAVAARTALVDRAKRVLPAEHKYDGQSVRQIQEAVLTHLTPTFDPKDRTDEYIGARFDQAMDERERSSSSNLSDARRLTTLSTKASRADAKEPPVPDWQKPLSYTRARTKVI